MGRLRVAENTHGITEFIVLTWKKRNGLLTQMPHNSKIITHKMHKM